MALVDKNDDVERPFCTELVFVTLILRMSDDVNKLEEYVRSVCDESYNTVADTSVLAMDDAVTSVLLISDEFTLACGKINEVDVAMLMALVVSCSVIWQSFKYTTLLWTYHHL